MNWTRYVDSADWSMPLCKRSTSSKILLCIHPTIRSERYGHTICLFLLFSFHCKHVRLSCGDYKLTHLLTYLRRSPVALWPPLKADELRWDDAQRVINDWWTWHGRGADWQQVTKVARAFHTNLHLVFHICELQFKVDNGSTGQKFGQVTWLYGLVIQRPDSHKRL